MKTGTLDKLKFKLLKNRLRIPLYSVMGLMEGLWYMTSGSAPDGAIGRHSNAEIAAWLEWEGDADTLIAAMVEAKFLDACQHRQDYRLLVHDWEDHCPNHIKNNMKRWGKEFAKDAPKEGSQEVTKEAPKEGPSYSIPVHSNPTQSNQHDSSLRSESPVLDLRSFPEDLERELVPGKNIGDSGKTLGALAYDAYALAYMHRYGAVPVADKKVRGQFKNLVDRLGADSVAVAGFYPSHNAALYVRSGHTVDLLLRDCPKLRTEWATGRKITETAARQQDRTGTMAQHAAELIEENRGN